MAENDLLVEVRLNQGYAPHVDAVKERIHSQIEKPRLCSAGSFSGEIRLLAIVVDGEDGAFDAAQWKALKEDLVLDARINELVHTRKMALHRVALEETESHFRWAEGARSRLVLVVSCPMRVGDDEDFRKAVRQLADYDRVELPLPRWVPRQAPMLPLLSEHARSPKLTAPPETLPLGDPPYRGVLIGQAGVGKTALFNAVCGTRHACGAAAASLTRSIFEHGLISGDFNTMLRDTPALESTEQAYQHAAVLWQALCTSPIHSIFIMVAFNPRYELVVQKFVEIRNAYLQGRTEYYDRVVLVVTKWDQCHEDTNIDPEQAFLDLQRLLAVHASPDAAFMCLSAHRSPGRAICNMLSFFMHRHAPTTLQLDRDKFLVTAQSIASLDHKMKEAKEQFEVRARDLAGELLETFQIFTQEGPAQEDKDEAALFLMVEYNQSVEKDLQGVRDRMGADMVEFERFCTYVEMQKSAVVLTDRFRDVMIAHMSYSPDRQDDPRNAIKKCPHCECVWVKVAGCNRVQCGNVTHDYRRHQGDGEESKLNWAHRTFNFYWEGPIRRLRKEQQASSASPAAKPKAKPHPRLHFENRLYPIYDGPTQDSSPRAGCGAELDWDRMPRCSPEEIKQFFSVRSMEAAVEHFRSGRQLCAQAEEGMDFSVHLESGSFSTSHFKKQYAVAVPCTATTLRSHMRNIVLIYCRRHELEEVAAEKFCNLLASTTLDAHPDENVKFSALRIWTSAWSISCGGKQVEFCHIVNEALTKDEPQDVVGFVRTLNLFLISQRVGTGLGVRLSKSYRGGGLPNLYRSFFEPGKKFRVARVLPTSASKEKADAFMTRQQDPPVRWSYHFSGRCVHVNYVDHTCSTITSDEEEFLFPPYSVFTVESVRWQQHPTDQAPHEVLLLVAEDNKEEPENLPVAPWC